MKEPYIYETLLILRKLVFDKKVKSFEMKHLDDCIEVNIIGFEDDINVKMTIVNNVKK